MTTESLTRRLARFAVETGYDDIPSVVVRESKRLLLDTIGCALGAINTPSGRVARNYATVVGGTPTATVLGLTEASAPTTAAYVNARLANVLDADDTFPTSSHFGNATIFSALALAEHFGRDGRDLITAIAVGFDVGGRIGCWMGWPVQFEDGKIVGWNGLAGPSATVTWSAIGSAVSIAGLNADQACHAFGIGGANSPLPSMHKFGEMTDIPMHKYSDAGWCAQVGVTAAVLARLGSTGFTDILDGDNGFWRFYGSPSRDDSALVAGLGIEWQILNTTYKPWPCCRYIQHPLTAFAKVRAEHGIRGDEIDKLLVRAMPFALSAMFQSRHPTDPLSAEFSHAHAFAAAAYDIPPGPLWYTPETLEADHIRAFRDRVELELEPTSMAGMAKGMEGAQWRGIPSGVDVYVRGKVYSATVDLALGDPWSAETLMSDADLVAKFRNMIALDPATGAGPEPVSSLAAHVISAIENIEIRGIAALVEPLSRLAMAIANSPLAAVFDKEIGKRKVSR